MIKQLVSVCLALSAVVTFSSCEHHRGSGHIVTENHSITEFTRLSVGGQFDVEYTQAPAGNLEISGDDNLMKYVEISNDGGELSIKMRKGGWFDIHKNFTIKVSSAQLEEMNLAGSGHMRFMNDFKGDHPLKTAIAGAGSISGKIDVPEFDAEIAGAGTYNMEGQTRKASISVMGSGDFNGYDLLTEETQANIAGSGNVHVTASRTLRADIAGSGDVRYKGSPEVSSSIGGSGSVRKG